MDWTNLVTLPTLAGLLYAGLYVLKAIVYRSAYRDWRLWLDATSERLHTYAWGLLQDPACIPDDICAAVVATVPEQDDDHPLATLVPALIAHPTVLHSDLLLDNAVEQALHQALGDRYGGLSDIYAEARTVGMLGTIAGLMLAMANFATTADPTSMMGALGLALGTTLFGGVAALIARVPLSAIDTLRDELRMEGLALAGLLRTRLQHLTAPDAEPTPVLYTPPGLDRSSGLVALYPPSTLLDGVPVLPRTPLNAYHR